MLTSLFMAESRPHPDLLVCLLLPFAMKMWSLCSQRVFCIDKKGIEYLVLLLLILEGTHVKKHLLRSLSKVFVLGSYFHHEGEESGFSKALVKAKREKALCVPSPPALSPALVTARSVFRLCVTQCETE